MNIFLFGILLLPAVGLLTIFIKKLHHKQEQIEISIKDYPSLFKEIQLSSSAYENCKINSAEILLDGKMYDIGSVRVSENNDVFLLILADREEDSIREEMMDILKKNKDDKNQNNNFVKEDLCDPICLHLDVNYSLLRLPTKVQLSDLAVLPLSSGIQRIFAPPPEFELN